ncbi:MAG TPA: hypothetical protein DDW23_03135 [Planctomycetes bacterium]|nr:hypothetical protein [Planctomycetota bacterium]|tara:strand:- start:164 stop:1198 length:1035 start_codon:yes stop_codon:yes gene_type:complete
MNSLIPLILLCSLAPSIPAAQHTILAEDSFDYAMGPLGDQDGGNGWASSWWSGTALDNAFVDSPGMDPVGNMATTQWEHGGSYRLIDLTDLGPILDNGVLGKDNTTIWFHCNMQRTPGGDDFYGGFSINYQWVGEQLRMGSPWGSDEWGVEIPFLTAPYFIPGTQCDTQAQLVTRIDFLPGDERVQMWVDPAEDYPTTLAGLDVMMPDMRFNEIYIQSGSGNLTGFNFDNIRVSTPVFTPYYTLGNLTAASPADISVINVGPGNTVIAAYSLTGPGPTQSPFGPVDLSQPIKQLPAMVAGSTGEASMTANVPPGTSGISVWSQAVELHPGGGGTLSNSLFQTIL